jgi:DNA-directed RNA polymerase subunit RPC12/RpoP
MQTQQIGNLLDLRCRCGYRATNLVDGGLMSGVSHLFTCSHCAEVVSALTWSVGILDEHPPGDVKATCPRCGGTELELWGQGSPPQGGCPRCGETVSTVSIGIAD